MELRHFTLVVDWGGKSASLVVDMGRPGQRNKSSSNFLQLELYPQNPLQVWIRGLPRAAPLATPLQLLWRCHDINRLELLRQSGKSNDYVPSRYFTIMEYEIELTRMDLSNISVY